MTRAIASAADGQATVELVALLPLIAVVALTAAAVLAGHGAAEQAGAAAQAGAMALLQGGDPSAAAREALPHASRDRATIAVSGRAITVRVRPRVPLVSEALTAESTAHAGPEPGR